jgi:ABC-2 type transport system permease protein
VARVLIGLRTAILRRNAAGRRGLGTLALLLLVAASAGGTLAAGLFQYHYPGAGASVLATLSLGWLAGWVAGPVVTGDDATLRLDYFKLLPVTARRLAYAMLAAAFANLGLVFGLVAFGSLIALGARSGPAAALAGTAAALLDLALAVVASTVAIAVLGPVVSSRRGRDFGSFLVAIVITPLAAASGLAPLIARRLTDGRSQVLADAVRVLPSGWGAVAVDAAGRHDWAQAGLALGGLAALIAALVAAWPALLRRRLMMPPGGAARHRSGGLPGQRRALPPTPLGAVIGKELRLYSRSALRSVMAMIAFLAGVAICVIPVASGDHKLLPFAGLMFAAIAAASFINMFGDDGTALWLTLVVPGAPRAEVRGRQWAWVLVTGPVSLALTVVLTAISGQTWAWPVVLPGEIGIVIGAAGLLLLASVLDMEPLAPDGGLTPRRVLSTHLALIAVPVIALWPAAALLVPGALAHLVVVRWLALPAELGWSVLLYGWAGRSALRRLEARGPELFSRVRGHPG